MVDTQTKPMGAYEDAAGERLVSMRHFTPDLGHPIIESCPQFVSHWDVCSLMSGVAVQGGHPNRVPPGVTLWEAESVANLVFIPHSSSTSQGSEAC